MVQSVVLVLFLVLFAAVKASPQARPGCGSGWRLAFEETGNGAWTDRWFLEGEQANVKYVDEALELRAGPTPLEDESHTVLWTRDVFEGDICVEYDFTRLDANYGYPSVNILYLQATGIGGPDSPVDISASSDRRRVPHMRSYYLFMNTLHISYATTGSKRGNYIAARRYPAESDASFPIDTLIAPLYEDVVLFEPGKTYRIVAEKRGTLLSFVAYRDGKRNEFSWELSVAENVKCGRVGLRQMWTRQSRYSGFRIYVRDGLLESTRVS